MTPGDVDALRAVSTEQLIEVATNLGTASPSGGGLSFQPVVDGTSLPQPPLDAIDGGSAEGVRVIVGTNLHEVTLFNVLDPQLGGITVDGVAPLLEPWYGGQSPEIVADYAARRSGLSGLELWTDIGTDAVFRIPAIRLAEAQGRHGAAFMYLFTWETPAFGGALRCTHALEIPFVFDNLDRGAELFTGDAPERQPLADAMHHAWIAFARARATRVTPASPRGRPMASTGAPPCAST